MNLLSIKDLHVYLGESHVLQGISFDVAEGGVTALLGRNGVGKTTTLRALLGLVDRRGTIEFAGDAIQHVPTHKIVRRGVGYVPEDRDVFAGLTVDENLRLETPSRSTPSCMTSSPSCANAASRRQARCREASSRCWRSAGRS